MAATSAAGQKAETGQVSASAAEIYEAFFVPALFGQWCEKSLAPLELKEASRFLDVACGTGIVAAAALDPVGPSGSVTGLDRSDDMLAVARDKSPDIEWITGLAEAMPFKDRQFDAVACQFALMFFEDRAKALQEMLRVTAPGGRISVAVWDKAENSPGYRDMIDLIEQLFGGEPADALRAPFVLGDKDGFGAVLGDAGIDDFTITTLPGVARFDSIDAWVHTDIRGWTLADMIDDEQFERLQREARSRFRRFCAADGSVSFAAPAHIAAIRQQATL